MLHVDRRPPPQAPSRTGARPPERLNSAHRTGYMPRQARPARCWTRADTVVDRAGVVCLHLGSTVLPRLVVVLRCWPRSAVSRSWISPNRTRDSSQWPEQLPADEARAVATVLRAYLTWDENNADARPAQSRSTWPQPGQRRGGTVAAAGPRVAYPERSRPIQRTSPPPSTSGAVHTFTRLGSNGWAGPVTGGAYRSGRRRRPGHRAGPPPFVPDVRARCPHLPGAGHRRRPDGGDAEDAEAFFSAYRSPTTRWRR